MAVLNLYTAGKLYRLKDGENMIFKDYIEKK